MTRRSQLHRAAAEGYSALPHASSKRQHRPRTIEREPRTCSDPEGLQRYVDECAAPPLGTRGPSLPALAHPRPLHSRGRPRGSITAAEVGPHCQDRPDGMPKAHGAVLPVIEDGRAF